MATLTYRCTVDPDCPSESNGPAFCQVHLEPLVRVRGTASAPAEPPPEPAPAPEPDSAPTPVMALDFRGALLVVPAGGMELGRDCRSCASVPGLADLRQIGRRHARLFWHEGALTVVDLDSVNGTWVDGRRIKAPESLPAGSAFRLALDVDIAVLEIDEYGFPKEADR
jgi:hypothetical protein